MKLDSPHPSLVQISGELHRRCTICGYGIGTNDLDQVHEIDVFAPCAAYTLRPDWVPVDERIAADMRARRGDYATFPRHDTALDEQADAIDARLRHWRVDQAIFGGAA